MTTINEIDIGGRHCFLFCDCHMHAMMFSRWTDEDLEYLEITPFSAGPNGERWSWRCRLRLIWHLIRGGHPYGDFVTLMQSAPGGSIDRLVEWLRARGESE